MAIVADNAEFFALKRMALNIQKLLSGATIGGLGLFLNLPFRNNIKQTLESLVYSSLLSITPRISQRRIVMGV